MALSDMKVDQLIDIIRLYGEPEIAAFCGGLCGIGVDFALKFAAAIAREIEATNEKQAMQAAVKAVDAEMDASEAADLALSK